MKTIAPLIAVLLTALPCWAGEAKVADVAIQALPIDKLAVPSWKLEVTSTNLPAGSSAPPSSLKWEISEKYKTNFREIHIVATPSVEGAGDATLEVFHMGKSKGDYFIRAVEVAPLTGPLSMNFPRGLNDPAVSFSTGYDGGLMSKSEGWIARIVQGGRIVTVESSNTSLAALAEKSDFPFLIAQLFFGQKKAAQKLSELTAQ